MKRRLLSGLVLLILLCGLWIFPALAASYATVTGGWLRLRSQPSYDASVVASYKTGTTVTVLSQEHGWARVLTPDYRIGYMVAAYLKFDGTSPVTPTAEPTVQPSTRTWTEINRTAYVTSANGRGVRLRNAPVVNNTNVLGLYPVGRTVFEVRRSSDGWSYIKIDQRFGYMMTQYLSTTYAAPAAVNTPAPMLPVVTATPAPVTVASIQSVRLSPYAPTVGDTITLSVTPSGAEYTAVWYNDQNTLLSTGKSYQVKAADEGHVIYVRIMGAGAYSGFVANASTDAVKAAVTVTAAPVDSDLETLTGPGEGIISEWIEDL